MLRAFAASVSCLLIASSAFAVEISNDDKMALKSLFGESVEADLKLSQFEKKDEAERQLYIVTTVAEDQDFSSGQTDTVANNHKFKFCEAYFKVMNQVIMDGRPANVKLVHTEGEPRKTRYSFKHIRRFLKNEPLVTDEERNTPKSEIASKVVQVNTLKVKNFGYEKHAALLEKCKEKRPRYGDKTTDKYFEKEYVYLIERLRKLNGSASPNAAPGTAAAGAVR